MFDPTLVYGQNVAKFSDGGDLLTAADVYMYGNSIKVRNLFNVELLNTKNELTDLHKNLFQRTLAVKEIVNELVILDSVFKVLIHDNSEIEAKIQVFTKCGTYFRRQEN